MGMNVTVVSGNFPRIKKERGKEKGRRMSRRGVLPPLSFQANFWLQGKLGLCWADQLAAKENVNYPLPLLTAAQPGQAVGGQASSLTEPSK